MSANARVRPGLLLAGATVVLCMIAACDERQSVVAPTEDALVRRLIDLGFRADMIEDLGGFFRVEGDIAISKASPLFSDDGLPRVNMNALAIHGQVAVSHGQESDTIPPAKQWHTTATVELKPIGVVVGVNTSALGSAWKTAVLSGMSSWNAINGSSVSFQSVSQGGIQMVENDGIGCGGLAKFPAGGLPGDTVYLGQHMCSLSSSQRQFITAHELGHTIGFRHTNWVQRGEGETPYGAHHIPGTPTGADPNSVMNGALAGQGIPNWSGFSTADMVALRYLYPLYINTFQETFGFPELRAWKQPSSELTAIGAYRYRFDVSSQDGAQYGIYLNPNGQGWQLVGIRPYCCGITEGSFDLQWPGNLGPGTAFGLNVFDGDGTILGGEVTWIPDR